ncbi:hypothetical protein TNCV_1139881 [Trichonephila clavipes]|nr:hypothetical protein TNCV_1139881 [Trichonephila clavipes]
MEWFLPSFEPVLPFESIFYCSFVSGARLLSVNEHPVSLCEFSSPFLESSSRWVDHCDARLGNSTATAGSDVVQSGCPIFDDFFQHLWPYIGNNTANVVFQMVKRLWLIRTDQ